jgi:hypothetical protein
MELTQAIEYANFPDKVIVLSGDLQKDMTLLRNISENPIEYKKDIDIDAIKNRISLLKNIVALFSSNS